eukprot:CAMPEP_0196802132 /NCGR_PEP_ID=MMETSP1362-20130617/1815_1 /TAXON_ID=163516 /ORGANISM="Leptocylindrus danicus, Strain CCMP1856" /LENGTH=435 /DNA_ID=CAMNT_0042173349 /DNA_START=272 /DNA_END=1579 /DNA_ORIENTATION=+
MAPYSFLETATTISTSDAPWFLQRIARSEIGTVFRIKLLPFGFGPDIVIAGDPKLAQSVLQNSENLKPHLMYKTFEPVTRGSSLFTTEGGRWHHARKATAPAFSSKHIKEMNATVLEQVNKWIQKDLVPNYVEKEAPFDVASVLLRQVLKGISVAGFEYEMSDEECEEFLLEWEIALREMLARSQNPITKIVSPFTSVGRRFNLAVDRNREFAKKVLEHYRSLECPSAGTIISMIANNANYESDEERVRDIMVFFLAGHDTTAFSLAWTLFELAKNKSEQTKLRSALRNTPREEWKNVVELRCVLKEGLRLHPVAALGSWRVLSNDINTGKYSLAKGAIIGIPYFVVHRNREYINNPDEFIPSRWIDPSEDLSSAYMPFALGRRNCVGQSLAYSELFICLATLVVDYEFGVFDEGMVDYFLTLKPAGVKLIAKRA